MQRTKHDISALIEKGETFHLECKKAQGGLPGSLWESYSAFCNTDGGVILLGVKEFEDKHFQVVGVSDAQKLVQDFTNTLNDRNKGLQKMFQFLGYSEKAGSGFPKIFMGTDEQHWERPTLREDFQLDQTYLNMPTVDLTEDSFQPEGGVKGGVKTTPITTPIRPESDQNPTRTRPESLDNLAPSCGLVYDALEKDNRLTYRMMAKALKLNKDTVNTAVQILIDHQLLRHVGPKKGGHWEIVKPQPPTGVKKGLKRVRAC